MTDKKELINYLKGRKIKKIIDLWCECKYFYRIIKIGHFPKNTDEKQAFI